jgi:hypothetical protein
VKAFGPTPKPSPWPGRLVVIASAVITFALGWAWMVAQ